jgi:hypothetical protein
MKSDLICGCDSKASRLWRWIPEDYLTLGGIHELDSTGGQPKCPSRERRVKAKDPSLAAWTPLHERVSMPRYALGGSAVANNGAAKKSRGMAHGTATKRQSAFLATRLSSASFSHPFSFYRSLGTELISNPRPGKCRPHSEKRLTSSGESLAKRGGAPCKPETRHLASSALLGSFRSSLSFFFCLALVPVSRLSPLLRFCARSLSPTLSYIPSFISARASR